MPEGAAEAGADQLERAKRCSQALGEVYQLYAPRITRYVVRRIGPNQEAEDIVANVFLAMVRHLPKYRATGAPFSAWLYRVATNEINWFLRKQRLRRIFVPLVDVSTGNRTGVPDDVEYVRESLLKLPLTFQSVLSLYYLEQLSVDEVSDVLGVAPGTVKSRLSRGRERLRETLSESKGRRKRHARGVRDVTVKRTR